MKEYRVRQQIMEGPNKGKWETAIHPNAGRRIQPFYTLEDAKNWIAAQPVWYEEYNRRWPPELQKEVPKYRIEAREVTPWDVIE